MESNMESTLNDASNPNMLRHPVAVISHFIFRLGALIVYLLCRWFMRGFIVPFVSIVVLLAIDFWTVKNVTGRMLVGLRWWNYVDDQGLSHWIFESKKGSELKSSPVESRLFWTVLFLSPLLWIIFFFVTLFSFELKWFVVVCVALALNGANLYGYVKCKLGKSQSVGGAASAFLQQNLIRSVMRNANPETPPTHTV